MKSFYKIISQDSILNRIQDAIGEVLNLIVKKPLVDGELVKEVDLLSGSDNYVNHRLNRPITGWVIVRKDSNANIYESATANALPSKHIILVTTANSTVDIWFF